MRASSHARAGEARSLAKELLGAVREAHVKNAGLRDQVLRAAMSACLNTAEGAERVSKADKARVFASARAEAGEATAGVEIAGLSGDARAEDVERVGRIANRLVALLTGLTRR
jgi:four helix bundle protein